MRAQPHSPIGHTILVSYDHQSAPLKPEGAAQTIRRRLFTTSISMTLLGMMMQSDLGALANTVFSFCRSVDNKLYK